MVSSAVIVPEQTPVDPTEPLSPTSPTRKRRQSSSPPFEPTKRPRLESIPSTNAGLQYSPPTSAAAHPPPRRKSTLTNPGAEEKKRGQRLFGGLLNTLSQPSSRPAHKKRDEIERRQRDRLRQDDADRAEEKRQKRQELDRVRRSEQHKWREEGLKIKHGNMRAMAGFLRTETKPRLCYRPWELRPGEEIRIKRQKDEVEEKIEKELASDRGKPNEDDSMVENQRDPPTNGTRAGHEADTSHVNGSSNGESEQHQDVQGAIQNPSPDEENRSESPPKQTIEAQQAKEEDHGVDDQVEGHGEDQVIY